jgi:hypothetical protein
MKKIFRNTLGIILIVLGFLALITPFTPGSWLILIGLEILGFGFLLEGRLSRFLRGKFKPFDKVMTGFKRKFQRKYNEAEQNNKEQSSK